MLFRGQSPRGEDAKRAMLRVRDAVLRPGRSKMAGWLQEWNVRGCNEPKTTFERTEMTTERCTNWTE